jgi:hypothetical protein
MNPFYCTAYVVSMDNDNDAFIPELWAREGLRILEENMVAAMLVHRDFTNEIAEFGDVVNTRRPGEFEITRKTDADEVTTQDARSTNVQVPLDQHFHVSFVIKDGEASKSFQDLTTIYMLPGMQTVARGVDRAVLGRSHAFYGTPQTRAGRLNQISESNARSFLLEARKVLNDNMAPMSPRNLILGTSAETALLNTELFISAEKRGDSGSALEEARLGRILGVSTFLDQNVSDVTPGTADTVAGTLTDPYTAGETGSLNSSIAGYEAIVGEFINVDGNDQPTYLTARTASTNTTAVTLNEALKYATLDNAVVTLYKACAVDGNFAAGYAKAITVDGYTTGKAPQVGQLIAFGTGASRRTYTIIRSTDAGASCTIWLDRPLVVALTNNQSAFPGPSGSFNVLLHPEALALVSRPLALPREGLGVMAANASYNNVGMRVVMSYDPKAQGTRVTLDMLAGVALLDSRLGCWLLG